MGSPLQLALQSHLQHLPYEVMSLSMASLNFPRHVSQEQMVIDCWLNEKDVREQGLVSSGEAADVD